MWWMPPILFVACVWWAHTRNLRWIRGDHPHYAKSQIELSINREIQLTRYAQWRGKHRPPTYPEDL